MAEPAHRSADLDTRAEVASGVVNRHFATYTSLTLDEARRKAQLWADHTDHLVKMTYWVGEEQAPVEIVSPNTLHFAR